MKWVLGFLLLLVAGDSTAQTRRGAITDGSVWCQNSPGMPARPGPQGYPGTGNQNPFGGECGPGQARPPPRPTVDRVIHLTTIGWINEHPNPFDAVPWGGGGLVGPMEVFAYQPQWVVKVSMGLIATANPAPANPLPDVGALRASRQFRSMIDVKVTIRMDAQTREPVGAVIVQNPVVLDAGWTPPFDRNRFPPAYLAIVQGFNTPPEIALRDSTWYPAELGRVSAVVVGRHPNSTLVIPAGERVLANGLIRFRAGAHTDKVGVDIGSPYHVPWVWNEVAITYAQGRYWLRGAAAGFPTTWWYVDGKRVQCRPRVADGRFPVSRWAGVQQVIALDQMGSAPALTTGAPTIGAQSPNWAFSGPVSAQPYTVGPNAAFPAPWVRGLDDGPDGRGC